MLASEVFELGAEGSELLLHEIGPDLGHILSEQPVLILLARHKEDDDGSILIEKGTVRGDRFSYGERPKHARMESETNPSSCRCLQASDSGSSSHPLSFSLCVQSSD